MEKFFSACGVIDETELTELLLRRYHTLEFIENMDLNSFCEFIIMARKKDYEDRLYMQWCGMLPRFEKYMPWNEFYDKMTGANIDLRPTDEIISEIEELHKHDIDRE